MPAIVQNEGELTVMALEEPQAIDIGNRGRCKSLSVRGKLASQLMAVCQQL